MLAYYYFKMYDGFSQYDIINKNEFQDDVEEELNTESNEQRVKQIKGLVRKERSITKAGVQSVIEKFLKSDKTSIFSL